MASGCGKDLGFIVMSRPQIIGTRRESALSAAME